MCIHLINLANPSTSSVLRRLKVSVIATTHPVFRVRVIEVSETLLAQDRWLCEEDLRSREDVVVVGEAALLELLARLGVSPQALEHHSEVDYPI